MPGEGLPGPEAGRPRRLSILFVTSDLFPPFRPAAKVLFSDGIVKRGHNVDWVLQAENSGTPAGARPYGTGTAYVARTTAQATRWSRLQKHWLALRNDCRAFTLLRRKAYSLVQIKDKYFTALPALLAARLFRVPVFYWLAYPHAEASSFASREGVARYSFIYALRGRLQQWLLYRILLPRCRHVFVQSEQMRHDVAARGVAFESTTAVPSSVNLAEIDAAMPRQRPEDSGPTVAYLGTLLRERGLTLLIAALAEVLPRVPDARLEFIGSGNMPEDEAALREAARRFGIESSVTITGWLPMREAWQRTLAARVCVSPYRPIPILRSTSPTKLVEYMALGKPVVGNDHPEQSQVLRQSGAGLVCAWDARDLANALVTLLLKPALCRQMGEAGRRYVERHRTHLALTDLVLDRYHTTLRELRPPVPATVLAARGGRGASQ
jgi:glycosyltransferase involved in cell wall biosynthesis